jgi:VWFA-related protein
LAQEAQGQRQERFRATTDLVRLDVSVLDRAGRPARGLSPADFVVKENGREQAVQAFVEVEVPGIEAASNSAGVAEPDVVRNDDVQESRLWVIVLDDATIPPSPLFVSNAKLIARRIVDRLSVADRAAVVFTRHSRNGQDFTTSRTRLVTAIETLSSGFNFTGGLGSRATPDDYWWESSVITLLTVAKYLAEVPDRRKVLVYISVGLPIDTGILAGVQLGAGGLSPSESQRRILNLLDLAFRHAQAANVSVYPIDPGGLAGLEGFYMGARRMRQIDAHAKATNHLDSLRTIAENTGGRALVDTNTFEPGLDQMFLENSAYYLVGFRPADPQDTRRFRPIEVTVRRPDVVVRARRGYYMPTATASEEGDRPNLPLTTAMAGLLPAGGLPLQVSAAAFPNGDGERHPLAVTIGFPKSAVVSSAPSLHVAIRAFTPNGRQRAGEDLNIASPRMDVVDDLAHEVYSVLEVPPGRYQLRIAAQLGATGPAGSVYHDVDVPDIRRMPLAMSAVVFSRGPSASPADRLRVLLPVVPTTQRRFAGSDRVRAFLQVSQARGTPENVRLSVSIQDAGGSIAWQESRSLDSAAFLERRTIGHEFELPVARLSEGAHLLRVQATRGNNAATQQVPFRVR